MINLTENEKKFIQRAINTTMPDLRDLNLDPTNKEDLILILKTFRSRGYITPKRMDQGKDFGLWYSILDKLGVKIKDRETILKEQEQKQADGIIERLNKIHDTKINNLELKLKQVKEEKEKALNEIEASIQVEIENIEKKKKDALQRLEVAQTAHEKLARIKKIKKEQKYDTDDKGLEKCMECGEWFKAGAGIASHMRNKHPELDGEI